MNHTKVKVNWANPATTAENEKLPGWLKWVWTGRGLAFSLNVVLMMQVTYYCTDLLGMPATLVGSLLMASKVVDACTDLIAGYIIDHTHTKWGKARPYEIFIVLTWVGTVFLFSVPNFGTVGKAVYVFILYALVNSICATFIMASDPVYMSRSIRSEKNKMSLTSFQGAFIMIGSILVGIIMPQLIKTLGAEKSGWTMIALVFAVPLSVIGSVRMFTVKEVAAQSQVRASSKTEFSIREGIRALLKNKMVLLLCGMAVLSNAISAVGAATSTYYFKWVFGDIGMVSLINLPTMLTPLLLAFTPVLSRKIGTGKLMRFGLAAAVLGYVVRLIGDVNLATIMLGTVLTAVGSIPLGTLLSIYEMECMDYGEWKTGVRVEGMITSTAGFFVKVGSAVGSGLLGLLMGLSGYVSSETAVSQSDNAINMIKFLFNGLPLMLAVGTLVLSVFYTIDKVRGQMYKDLNKN